MFCRCFEVIIRTQFELLFSVAGERVWVCKNMRKCLYPLCYWLVYTNGYFCKPYILSTGFEFCHQAVHGNNCWTKSQASFTDGHMSALPGCDFYKANGKSLSMSYKYISKYLKFFGKKYTHFFVDSWWMIASLTHMLGWRNYIDLVSFNIWFKKCM